MHLSKFLIPSFLALILTSANTHATNTFGADDDYDKAVAEGLLPKAISIDQLRSFLADTNASTGEHLQKKSGVHKRKAEGEVEVAEDESPKASEEVSCLKSLRKSKKKQRLPKDLVSTENQSIALPTEAPSTDDPTEVALGESLIHSIPNGRPSFGIMTVSRDSIPNLRFGLSSFSYSSNYSSHEVNGQLVQSSLEVKEVQTVGGATSYKHILADQIDRGSGPHSKFLLASGQHLTPNQIPAAFDASSQSYGFQPFVKGVLPFNRASLAAPLTPLLGNIGNQGPIMQMISQNRGTSGPENPLDVFNMFKF